jgi:putative CocE/NonD family hydrolase
VNQQRNVSPIAEKSMEISRRNFLLASGASVAVIPATSFLASATEPGWKLPARQPIKTLENIWIPLKDGQKLAMRLWVPESADQSPVPVVLEYLPYRKRDNTRRRDQSWGESFAPYGFAYARVDIRGTGESDGVLLGEYLQREQDDAVEVIAWLSRQPWCSGAVGMRGISWGGFNSLQVAATAPPALKGIVTQCATDNRYTDDAHYVGGALTYDDLEWAADFKNVLVAPPDPAIVGEPWRKMWIERLKSTLPIATEWLSHQRYDAFWQHGSVAVDYASIKCPVYAVDGQIDAYRDFVSRLLTGLKVPRKGLIGAWGHRYPQKPDPGPGLDWVQEEVRWWTLWLKGIDTGIMKGPMLRAYMETTTASEVWPKDVPGRWVSEDVWPSPGVGSKTLYLNSSGLADRKEHPKVLICRSQETVGLTKREWYVNDMEVDLPPDQTPDDKRSLLFDSLPLEADLEIMGNPKAVIRVSSNRPVAKLAVRINEVTPDGKSWNVSYGVLNLTHRDGHESPAPLLQGREYDIGISCYFATHRFKKGSRLRVAITESLWPMVWPSPLPVTLKIVSGESRLILPVRARETADQTPPIPILRNVAERHDTGDKKARTAEVIQTGPDANGFVSIRKTLPQPAWTVEGVGTLVSSDGVWTRSIREGDPNSSVWLVEWTREMKRGEWNIKTHSTVELTSTADEFRIKESIAAWERETKVFERAWDNRIRRDLM